MQVSAEGPVDWRNAEAFKRKERIIALAQFELERALSFSLLEDRRMSTASSRACVAAAIIVTLAVIAPAHSPFQGSNPKVPTGSISGRVTVGDLPARGVTVLLTSPDNGSMERPLARATTDRDGRFQMTGVPAGQHLIQAFAPALTVEGETTMGRSGKPISLTAGETVEGLDIALNRGAAITGQVSDANGQPVIGENVRLFAVGQQGRKVPIYLPYNFMSTTDDRGVYRLFGVPPGRYILCTGVDTSVPSVRTNSANTFYPITYHPDATDETNATVIEVAAGGEATGVDIVLARVSKGYSVSGRIVDAETGKPVVGMMYGYGAMNRGDGQFGSTGFTSSTTNARGEFLLEGVTPGKYAAFASPANDSEMYSDLAPFTVDDGNVTGLVVKLHAGSSITGTVIIEGAEGQQGAPRIFDIRFGVSSGSLNVFRRSSQVVIAPDGSFRIAGLPRGVTNFSIYYPAPKGVDLARVERDGVSQKNGIEVGVNEEISGVRVVFSYGTGAVRGQVKLEGREIPGGAMMFLSVRRIDGNQQVRLRAPTPDSRGRFVIDGLLPGDYEISLVFQTRPAVPGADGPHAISKSVNKTVTVTNGTETQVTLIVDLNSNDR